MDNPILQALAESQQEVEPQVEEQEIEQVENQETEQEDFTESVEEEETEETEQEDVIEENVEGDAESTEQDEGGEEWGDNSWLESKESEPEEKGNPSFDGISEALGMGGFNDEQSVIAEVKNIAKERDELRKAVEESKNEAPFANEDIKRANELAKSGGDFNSYLQLSQIDYNSVDDETLLMEGLIRPSFKSEEEAQEYFSGMTEPQKKMEAQRFRNNLIQEQGQKKQDIIKQANDKRASVNDGIKNALTKKDTMFGMTIKNSDKKKLFSKLTSEKGIINDIFYDKKGNMDYNKMVEAAYILDNFETIVKSAITKSRNSATKEIINEATNVNLGKKSKQVSKSEKKQMSPLEAHIESMKNKSR